MNIFNKFIENYYYILEFIMRLIKFLDIILKNYSIDDNIFKENFNYIFNIGNIIIWKMSIILNIIKIKIFIFNISFVKKFCDILIIKLYYGIQLI